MSAKKMENPWKFNETKSIFLDLKEKRQFGSMSTSAAQDKSRATDTNLNYWLDRWQTDQIGFHRKDVNKWVKDHTSRSYLSPQRFPLQTIQQVHSLSIGFVWATAMCRVSSLRKNIRHESSARRRSSCCWPWSFSQSCRSILSGASTRLSRGSRRERSVSCLQGESYQSDPSKTWTCR